MQAERSKPVSGKTLKQKSKLLFDAENREAHRGLQGIQIYRITDWGNQPTLQPQNGYDGTKLGESKMVCPNCKLENPDGAVRCDCGYEFTRRSAPMASPAPSGKATGRSVLATIFWILSFLASFAAGIMLFATFISAGSAPQQGAGAALAAALAVIPYCLARTVSELGNPRRG